MEMEQILELQTKNFLIRHLEVKNLPPEYFLWLKDPDVTQHLFISRSMTNEESAKSHVASCDGVNRFFFGLFDRVGEKLIGTHGLSIAPEDRRCAMGVMIGDKDYWGRNVVVEVRTSILEFVFGERDCEKAEAGCFRSNLSSIYNFQRLGWKLEGVRRGHRIVHGEREDLLLFGLTREEWNARNQAC